MPSRITPFELRNGTQYERKQKWYSCYVCCVDCRKAFDNVWKNGLWTHYGYPEKLIRISAVRVDVELTE